MTDRDSLICLILKVNMEYKDLYAEAPLGSWREREWSRAGELADRIMEAGWSK